MEGTHIFTCVQGSSVKSLFKKEEGMYLKVEGNKVSGKGNICNAEGRNGYQDEFSFSIDEISDIREEDYNGLSSVAFTAQLRGLYGNKKVKIYIPQLKQPAEAISVLKRMKAEAGSSRRPSSSAPETKVEKKEVKVEKPEVAAEEQAKSTETIYRPVGEGYAGGTAPTKPTETKPEPVPETKPEPVPEPVPEPETVPEPEPIPEPEPVVEPEPVSEPEPEPVVEEVDKEMSEEEFQKRMDKLNVLKDCGLLGEKEFASKKLELVSEFFDLGDFNDRIQKLIALKECGLLSEKEFEENRMDVIKECCDLDVEDVKAYRSNVQKLTFLEIGEIITPEEYEASKKALVDDVQFSISDSKDIFTRKLKRLPVLQSCRMIEEKDYRDFIDNLNAQLEVTKSDSRESLVNKLTKWPLMAQERYWSIGELKDKQNELISTYLDVAWKTPEELKAIINRMSALREGECLSDADYKVRRNELLGCIEEVEDYSTKVAMYRMLPQVGFISENEYAEIKQKCIDKIFTSSNSVSEFKERANNLVELQKVGMLTSEEFNAYKSKLMSEL